MNGEEPEEQIITPEMNIVTKAVIEGIKSLLQRLISRKTGKVNRFDPVFNAFQNIKMNTLGTADGVPVENKKKRRWFPLFYKYEGVDNKQRERIGDPKRCAEDLNFCEVVHFASFLQPGLQYFPSNNNRKNCQESIDLFFPLR